MPIYTQALKDLYAVFHKGLQIIFFFLRGTAMTLTINED